MRRAPLSLLVAALLAAALAAGCSPSEDDVLAAGWSAAQDVEDGAVERFALLTATAVWPRARAAQRSEPMALRAVFVAHEGQTREAVLDVLNLPQLLRLQPEDSCSLVSDDGALRSGGDAFRSADDGWVDLRDAGRVVAQVGAATGQELEAQFIPDVVSTISGVTYAAAAGLGDGLLGHRTAPALRFVGSGSGEVGPFEVGVDLPAPVRLYAVGGRYPQRGHVRVARAGDLPLRWDARGTAEEPLLVELTRRSFGAVDTVRCVVVDDGAFVIPAAARDQLPDHREPATDRLTVRRAAGAEFYARGIDEAWAFAIAEDFVLLDPVD